MKLYIINGPNLTMLGIREPDTYGKCGYGELCHMIEEHAKENGFDVVIAHVDRYPEDIAEALLDAGFKCQLNAESLCTPLRKKKTLGYFSMGDIVALGSDIHGANEHFATGYKKACRTLDTRLDAIMATSAELLAGEKSIN